MSNPKKKKAKKRIQEHQRSKKLPGWYCELSDGKKGRTRAGSGIIDNRTPIWLETSEGIFSDQMSLYHEKDIKRISIINLDKIKIL